MFMYLQFASTYIREFLEILFSTNIPLVNVKVTNSTSVIIICAYKMSTRRRRSSVWKYFEQVEENVVCLLCNKRYKYFGNTTNLSTHITRKHVNDKPQSNTESINALSVIFQDAAHGSQVLPLSNINTEKRLSDKHKKIIDDSLIKMIVDDYQPLSIVENKGFINFCNKMQPKYILPSRRVLSSTMLPNFYKSVYNKTKTLVTNANHISITTDIWTSEDIKSYITVTGHFVHTNKRFNLVLCTKQILEQHTGRNIAAILSDVFHEWGINEKIVAIVTDNGSNIKNAVREHLKKEHLSCVAHTLNLIVKESLNDNRDLLDIIKKCRNIVMHFKHSVFAADKLRQVQSLQNLPLLQLKQDVSTRWNSTVIMIDRLLTIKNVLLETMTDLPRAPEQLDEMEWSVLTDCSCLLNPLKEVTEELSGENYPTLSMTIPLIKSLAHTIHHQLPTTSVGILLQQKLLNTIERRLSVLDENKIAAVATFLDPRFKKVPFQSFSMIEEWVADEIVKYKHTSNPPATETVTSESHSLQSTVWKYFDNLMSEVTKKQCPPYSSDSIIKRYLDIPNLNRTINPEQFWQDHSRVFPELYSIQQKYLSIPATSVPSERIFSKAGLLLNGRRNRLSAKNVNEILFLNHNLYVCNNETL